MRKIWTIAWKELYMTFSDRNLVAIMIAAPLAISTIIGLAFGGLGGGEHPQHHPGLRGRTRLDLEHRAPWGQGIDAPPLQGGDAAGRSFPHCGRNRHGVDTQAPLPQNDPEG